ncbi:hypothetical protein BpHYR1_026381 [Brachionus plicatilis]|uniref:Uncharacterized protein n=1 Tax=Brachionus plicatilis TaxID=10195 RepID=A0A3M7SV51_BRAPC|nr:hypothetical protein BpHYR1_026381 [Brachionus plicatilis]
MESLKKPSYFIKKMIKKNRLDGSARSLGSAGSEPQTGRDGRPRWPLFGRGFFCVTVVETYCFTYSYQKST